MKNYRNYIILKNDVRIEGLSNKTEQKLAIWEANKKEKIKKDRYGNIMDYKSKIKCKNNAKLFLSNIIKISGANVSNIIKIKELNINDETLFNFGVNYDKTAFTFQDNNNKQYLVILAKNGLSLLYVFVANKDNLNGFEIGYLTDYKKIGPFTMKSHTPYYYEKNWFLGKKELQKYYNAAGLGKIPDNINPTYEELMNETPNKKQQTYSTTNTKIKKLEEEIDKKEEQKKQEDIEILKTNNQYDSCSSKNLSQEAKHKIMTANILAHGITTGTALNIIMFHDDEDTPYKRR